MPRLDAIGVIVSDMGRAIEFYRLVGLEFAVDADEVHAEATGPEGIRVMLDTEASVMSFSDWQPPTGGGPALLWPSSATRRPTSTGFIRRCSRPEVPVIWHPSTLPGASATPPSTTTTGTQ